MSKVNNARLPDSFDETNLQTVASLIGLKTQAGQAALKIALENICLLDKKQLDYGPNNIARAGTYGCIVRMGDKFERLDTLFKGGRKRRALNESVRDTFRDLANYAVIALLCDLQLWPGIETLATSKPMSTTNRTAPRSLKSSSMGTGSLNTSEKPTKNSTS